MKGVTDLYFNHKIDELCDILEFAIKRPQSVSTKIDGKPALFIWSSFPGLRGPGVGFKSLLEQLKRPDRQLGTYFTSDQEINDYMLRSERTEGFIKHRGDSFKCALKMAPFVAPGHILWGDVLFTPGEIKSVGGLFSCTPNTIEYQIDPKVFPQVKNANFGIFLHTDIDGKLGTQTIKNLSKLLTYKGEMVLQPSDLVPETDLSTSELMSELDRLRQDGQECKDLMEANDILRTTCRRLVNKIDMNLTKKIENLPNKYKEDGAKVITNAMGFINLKEYILNNTSIHGIKSLINGERSNGEGYVIDMPGHEPLKLVSDTDFTAFNKIHMAYSRMNERIVDNGQTVLAWSSSKDTQLFNYYLSKNLRYGDNGGSNYGFATYCVTEPPFTDAAQVGYSDEYRRKLYGDNIFEFMIPTDRIIFFDYQDYLKSKQGQKQQASFDNFVRVQLQALGVRMTEEEYQSLQPVDEKKPTASVAVKLYQIMSRYFYQGHRGNLRTPIDGFQYRGRNDGNTLVVWNSNRLIPVKYSNDLGQTWKDCDKNSEVYKEYLRAAENANYTVNEPKYQDSIFDGHKTPEKKEVYRLLMAFNSNDGVNDKGKSLGLSDGIFYNIKIKDDKKIDASFKFNLPYVDYGEHFFRLRKNQFLDQIFNKGYRFGTLDCGLKIGSEHNLNETWESVEDRWWPEEVTGGFKLVCLPINKRQFKYQTKFGQKKLYLTKCHIEEDVFDGWEVLLDPEKPNFCKKEVKDQLTKKYDWAYNLTEEEPLMESAIKKYRLEEAINIDPNLESEITKMITDCDLRFTKKGSSHLSANDIYDSIANTKNYGLLVFVERDPNKGFLERNKVVDNFINYVKNNPNSEYLDQEKKKIVYTTILGTKVTFRFKVMEGEGRSSSTKSTFDSESTMAFLISNYDSIDFSMTYEEMESYLQSQGINTDFFNQKFYNAFKTAPKLIKDFFGSNSGKLIAERSVTSDLGKRIALVSIKKKSNRDNVPIFGRYEQWNPADLWIYPESKKSSVDLILTKAEMCGTLEELNDIFIEAFNNKTLVGFSCKALITKEDTKFNLEKANYTQTTSTDIDTFDSVRGLEQTSMYLTSEWSKNYLGHGYQFRSKDIENSPACVFNIVDPAAQGTSTGFVFYKNFDLFTKNPIYLTIFNKSRTIGFNDTEVLAYTGAILNSNLKLEDKTKKVITDWNTDTKTFTMLSTNYKVYKSQQLALTYILSQVSEQDRSIFCTQVWKYCRKKDNIFGPYLYIGH